MGIHRRSRTSRNVCKSARYRVDSFDLRLLGAWASLTLFSYPYVLLTVRSAWMRLDPGLEEASRMLGRSSWHTFLKVVWPQLRPAVSSGVTRLAVLLERLWRCGHDAVRHIHPRDLPQYRGALERGASAVLGLMLVVLPLLCSQENNDSGDEKTSTASTAQEPELHNRLNSVAYGFLRLRVSGFSPHSHSQCLSESFRTGSSEVRAGEPVWPLSLISNSLSVSLLAAAVATIAAVPVAMIIRRSPGRFANVIERLSWSGYALPGIVVALALVYFGANAVPWAYQSLAMLVFAYSILFLPRRSAPCDHHSFRSSKS